MKNSCPSRASSARPKSVLGKPALTRLPQSHLWLELPYKFVDMRPFYFYAAETSFRRYEPEVWTAAESRMMQFAASGYADPIEFFIENVGTLIMLGDPAFFTLLFHPLTFGPVRDEVREWSVIHFALITPPYVFPGVDWTPPEGVEEQFNRDFVEPVSYPLSDA